MFDLITAWKWESALFQIFNTFPHSEFLVFLVQNSFFLSCFNQDDTNKRSDILLFCMSFEVSLSCSLIFNQIYLWGNNHWQNVEICPCMPIIYSVSAPHASEGFTICNLCTFTLYKKEWTKVYILLLHHLDACYIMSTSVDEPCKCMDFFRTCACRHIHRNNQCLAFNVSAFLSFSDEVSPCTEWLPRKRKRGRTNLQHDWLLSPPSPLFISTTISGIFINPHGSMCLGVVKIDKWLIRIPPFYFPTD